MVLVRSLRCISSSIHTHDKTKISFLHLLLDCTDVVGENVEEEELKDGALSLLDGSSKRDH